MRRDAHSDRSYDDQPISAKDTLQDGGSSRSARSPAPRRFHDDNRPSRCISSRAIAPISSAELSIPTESKTLSVAGDALRVSRCPTNIHENDACSCASSSSTRPAGLRVFGRHPSDGELKRTVSERHEDLDRVNRTVRSANEPKEIKAHSEPDSKLSGNHNRLPGNGLSSATRQDLGHSEADKADSAECTEITSDRSEDTPKSRGQTAINVSLRSRMSTALEQSHSSPSLSGILRFSKIGPNSSQRSTVVGRGSSAVCKETDPIRFSGVHLRYGRVGNGLGSRMLSSAFFGTKRSEGNSQGISTKDRMLRSLDLEHVIESKRIDSNIASSSVSDQKVRLEELLSSSANRQSDLHVPHQQDGRTSSSTMDDCRKNPQICIGSRVKPDGRISARRVELGSRPLVASATGFLPISDQSTCVPLSEQTMGTVHTGLLRVRSELSSSPIRELPHGSELPVHGLSIASSGSEGKSLVPSAICVDRQVIEQNSERRIGSNIAVPVVASSALVADCDLDDDRLANHRSTEFRHASDSKSERKIIRHSNMEQSAHEIIRHALTERGLAPDTVSAVFERWKNGCLGPTVRKFNSKFATFCKTLAIIGGDKAESRMELLATDDVANVMTYLINEKKQKADTIRGFLSALDSMKNLMFPHAPRLNDETSLKNIVKGHRRKNPKTDKRLNTPTEYYSVFQIYQNFPSKIHLLTVLDLRNAIIPILAFDLLARASDLFSIDRGSMVFHKDGNTVSFEIVYPKESKEDCRKKCTVRKPKSGIADCVAALRMYIEKTRSLKIQRICGGGRDEYLPLFVKVPTEYKKKDRSLVTAITTDRISKIIKTAILAAPDSSPQWTAHSARGAAVSKLINLGVDSARWASYGRWASNQTGVNHYLKKVVYQNVPRNIRDWEIVDVLRYKAERIDNGRREISDGISK